MNIENDIILYFKKCCKKSFLLEELLKKKGIYFSKDLEERKEDMDNSPKYLLKIGNEYYNYEQARNFVLKEIR